MTRRQTRENRRVQPELPTGTVTFLFTDIEGSTRLLQELGDGYADVLAEHHRALRDAWRRTTGSRSTRRATRSSSPSRARPTPWRPPPTRNARLRLARCVCGWGCTRASRSGRRGLRRVRRAPGGADRGCRARRPGAAVAGDGGSRRRRRARSRFAPAEGPERAGAPLPARDGGLSAAEDVARDEPAGSGDAVPRPRARRSTRSRRCCGGPTSGS